MPPIRGSRLSGSILMRTQERVAAVVDQFKNPMRELVQLVGELANLEVDLSNTPPEVTTDLNLSGDGILIIPLPTDPPLLVVRLSFGLLFE
jgi:hypothetical protein